MQHSTSDRPWLITASGFFFKLPRRVAPLGAGSTPIEVAAKHNEILESLVEAGILAAGEVAPVRHDESPALVHASLGQRFERLLEERAGLRAL